MISEQIYEYFERIANLLRTDARKAGDGKPLQPVQLEALHYLAVCNRYSNTPAAVADYLGLTKGTVSQTLGILEAAGLVEKRPDLKDRRVVHLSLTGNGRALLQASIPPPTLRQALDLLTEQESQTVLAALNAVLRAMQKANGLRTFGQCQTCKHHRVFADDSRGCALTGEALSLEDAVKICREHEFARAAETHGAA